MKEPGWTVRAQKDDRDSQTELGFDKPNASFASSSPDTPLLQSTTTPPFAASAPSWPVVLNDRWRLTLDDLQWILEHSLATTSNGQVKTSRKQSRVRC